MMIVCEEDEEIQFLTKNSKNDNNEASTTSDNFSSTNEIKRSSPANSATDTASTSSTETTARSIQNLQVQGRGSEEELSVLDDEDGIITSGRREWTREELMILINAIFSRRINPQKLYDLGLIKSSQQMSKKKISIKIRLKKLIHNRSMR